jgi:hypothetical protein
MIEKSDQRTLEAIMLQTGWKLFSGPRTKIKLANA